ncbi:putative membrane protein (GlpM family) [Pseudomonas protegens]|jgi:uncharacterized membrane protein (GlpM family)|nr:hypothetical protein [Pseudomonas protegens]GED78145.1 hypothetical protein PFL02_49950 [Pseudomonas fluorescens]AQT09118.1 membrane protein [Pseudomonas protegens]MBF0643627.1 hypothetical protein [Pseudomonas protegens]MBP5113676.1 hypothetical protein [Pseudomonas protegens]MDT3424074.1 putative membrane protein (GlpM family) [Pseudomonas protegens]
MLLLKLLTVPGFLWLISLASKRWGPNVAGWLAGFPVVVGPILLFLALEQGQVFATHAAVAALSAVFAMIAFSVAYTHAAQRFSWPGALAIATLVWALLATVIAQVPPSLGFSSLCAASALLLAPRLFPPVGELPASPGPRSDKLPYRMLAGALLTLAVTLLASTVGERWSGMLAVFPVLGSVLAVFSHQSRGVAFTTVLLRSLTTGLYAFAAFCLALALALPPLGMLAFAVALAASMLVLGLSKRLLRATVQEPAGRRRGS